MKVLLVTEATAAGVGRHVIDLANGLVERDCEVHLAYSPLRIDAPFASALREMHDLHTTQLSMRRAPHPSDAAATWRLRKYATENGPWDIVHAHSSKAGVIARAVGGTGGARLVYTPHCIYTMNPQAGRFMSRLTAVAERSLARRTAALIAVSPGERDHLLELGIEAGRVHFIPNGQRSLDWRPRAVCRDEWNYSDEHVVIGFLGRLELQKNPTLLLRAFAELRRTRPHLRLCMVGDGPLGISCRGLARELGIEEDVTWTGARNPETIMRAFDIFAMPSNYEAMPYVLLEALAAQLPIVATPVGGVPITVEDGVNGSVAAGFSSRELQSALEQVVDDPEHRARCAAASLAKSSSFSSDTMVTATLRLYRELTGAR